MGDIVVIYDSLTFANADVFALRRSSSCRATPIAAGFRPVAIIPIDSASKLLPLRCAGASNAKGGAFQQPPLNRGQSYRG
jgi:hypothetical protein